MMCNRMTARFLSFSAALLLATTGCGPEGSVDDVGTPVPSEWATPPTPVNTVWLDAVEVPADGGAATFAGGITIGIPPANGTGAPLHSLLIGTLRFSANDCDVFSVVSPATDSIEIDSVTADDGLSLLPLNQNPRAWLEAIPTTAGEFTITIEGKTFEGWGQTGPNACAAFEDHDGRFVATIVVTVLDVRGVEFVFPERCQRRAVPTYFVGDDLLSIKMNAPLQGSSEFAANFPIGFPLPVRIHGPEGMVQIPDRVTSFRDLVLLKEGDFFLEAPGFGREDLRAITPESVSSADPYFVLTGEASINVVLDSPRHGDDGWGRTRNAMVPLLSSVTLDGGVVACGVQTPPVRLVSRSESICVVEQTDRVSDVSNPTVFDREEFLWWAGHGFYAVMLQDGECRLTLESTDPAFDLSHDFAVTIVNVDRLLPTDF